MKKIQSLKVFGVFLLGYAGYSQVGIGTLNPDPSAQLDIVSSDKGLLIPRVALTGVTDMTTIVDGNVESLLVYNTTNDANISAGYYYWFEGAWKRIALSEEVANGPDNVVVWDPINNDFTYVDSEGVVNVIDLADLIKESQVVSTLEDKKDGTYLYTDETGLATTVDVPGSVINNAGDIFTSTPVVEEITNLIDANAGDIFNSTNVVNEITNLIDSTGGPETLTPLVDNTDGTYTYTDEVGTVTTIDVPASVINNADTIFGSTQVVEEVTNLIDENAGDIFSSTNVINEVVNLIDENAGDVFNSTNVVNEVVNLIDENAGDIFNNTNVINEIKGIETLTPLVDNTDGTYTYTDEAGTATTIDVPASVINNAGDIFTSTPVVEEITNLIDANAGDIFSSTNVVNEITNLIDSTGGPETLTPLVDNNDGTYLYTDEGKTATTIDVPGDVINNAGTIFGSTQVIEEVVNLIDENAGDIFSSTNVINEVVDLIDENAGDIFSSTNVINEVVNLIDENAGDIFSSTNVINEVVNLIDENAGDIFSSTNVVNEVTNLIDENAGDIFSSTNVINEITNLIDSTGGPETLTPLVDNNDGTYLYTDEGKTATTIDVPGDVINNADTIFGSTQVIEEVVNLIDENAGDIFSSTNVINEVVDLIDENAGDIFSSTNVINEVVNLIDENAGDIFSSTNVINEVVNLIDENAGDIFSSTNVVNEVTNLIDENAGDIFSSTNVINEITNLIDSTGGPETLTPLVDNNDGTYLYTDEGKTATTIDVPGDVINNADTIFGSTQVIEEVVNLIDENAGDIFSSTNVINEVVNLIDENAGDIFSSTNVINEVVNLIDENAGDIFSSTNVVNEVVNLIDENAGDIFNNTNVINEIKGIETLTPLVDNTDGTYTYTDEEGTATTIDVPASVINNAADIFTSTPVVEEITNLIDANAGDIFSSTNVINEITNLIDSTGGPETLTPLVDNNDGTYLYTDEGKTATTIDVPGDVINNADTIFGSTQVINEVISLITDPTNAADIFNNTNVVNEIKKSETVSSMVDNNDGTYSYTDEAGKVTTIDVPASVINNAGDIFTSTPVVEEITNLIDANAGDIFSSTNVVNEITNLIDSSGGPETLTPLVDNNNGTYTYTDEGKKVTTIDVPGDVINNAGTIFGNTFVQAEIKKTETVSSMVDNNDGTYSYTDEAGKLTTIDVPGDVINNAGTIFGNTFVQAEIKKTETVSSMVDNNNGTYSYTDEAGKLTTIDVPGDVINNAGTIFGNTFVQAEIKGIETVSPLVDNNNGTYDYTDEKGNKSQVDVPGDVIGQATTIFSNTNVIAEIDKNLGESYSYAEKATGGTWVDGREIFSRTFKYRALTNTAIFDLGTSFTISKVLDVSIAGEPDGKPQVILNTIGSYDVATNKIVVGPSPNNSDVQLAGTYYITITYVK